jgi:hypothetical protein
MHAVPDDDVNGRRLDLHYCASRRPLDVTRRDRSAPSPKSLRQSDETRVNGFSISAARMLPT